MKGVQPAKLATLSDLLGANRLHGQPSMGKVDTTCAYTNAMSNIGKSTLLSTVRSTKTG